MILQIAVEFPKLCDKEHPLVHDGARRHGADIGVLRALLELTAHDVEPAVKVDALLYALRLPYEALPDRRHARCSSLPQDLRTHRHLSPSEEGQLLFADDHLHHPHGKHALHGISGEKQHTDPVFALFSQKDLLRGSSRFKESMGDLGQDPHAVAHLAGGVLAGTVIQLLHDVEGIIQHPVFSCPVYIDDRTDTAGIAFFQKI